MITPITAGRFPADADIGQYVQEAMAARREATFGARVREIEAHMLTQARLDDATRQLEQARADLLAMTQDRDRWRATAEGA